MVNAGDKAEVNDECRKGRRPKRQGMREGLSIRHGGVRRQYGSNAMRRVRQQCKRQRMLPMRRPDEEVSSGVQGRPASLVNNA